MVTINQWRRAMYAGIGFVVLFLVALFLSIGNTPDIENGTDAAAAAQYVTYLSSSGHRTALVISGYLLVLSALAFLWFVTVLRSLVSSPTAGRMLTSLGVLGAGAVSAGAMISITPAGVVSLGSEPLYSGQVIRALMDMMVPFVLIIFGLITAAIAGVVSVELMRARALPRWLGYVGWLAVLGGLFAVEFTPFALTLLWFLALAVTGLVRPVGVAATGPEPTYAPAPAAGV